MRRAWVLLLIFFVVLIPARAGADANVIVKIKSGEPNLNPAQLQQGGMITWHNDDSVGHEVEFEQGAITVPAKSSSEPLAISHSFDYKIDNGASVFSVVVSGPPVVPPPGPPVTPPPGPAITTTTATTAPPPTTTAPPPTTEAPTTTTTETTTSTTTTTTEPSSASAFVPIGESSGDNGGSAAPLLTASSIVVAGLAGLVYYLWWRSGETRDEFTELNDVGAVGEAESG